LVILVAIFLLQSAPIDPAAYTPPKAPELTGVLAPNNLLQKAELLAQGKISGPEEVAVDSQGQVYGGTQDGKIMRLLPDGKLEVFAETKGRPLGLQFDKHENLIVCDAYKGLLSIDPQGKIKVLALDENGKITQSLHEPTGNHLKEIASAREYGGYLYLGSLHNDRIGKYKLPG
jgi:streptogramin lyase